MRKINNKGFAAVEGLLIVLVLAVIGFGGYYVWHTQHKTKPVAVVTTAKTATPAKTTTPTTTPDPYAGWKTYALPVEKLGFMYPSDWTISNNPPTSTQDDTTLTASDGFSFEISDGNGNGGDSTPEAPSSSAIPVKFVGQSDYLVLIYGTGSVGHGSSDGLVAGAMLQTSTNEQAGPNGGYPLPTDKYAYQSNPEYGGGPVLPGDPTDYISIACSLKSQITLQQAASNSDFKNAELVIESMKY